jgi:galactokinase
MLLDCRSHETQMVPMTDPSIAVLIINSNVKHNLSGGEYAQRRSQCETASRVLGVKALRDATLDQLNANKAKMDDVTFRRARHVIGENDRTVTAAQAARENNWQRFGELMYDSHRSLQHDFEVSCEELDLLVELAGKIGLAGGVYGSRMTGGGFGGCTVSIVRADKAQQIQDAITTAYKAKTGIDPIAFVTQAAQGARILSI